MLLQQIINGLTIGFTYSLVAIGYSLVFGILKIINFANGSVYMLGAYSVFITLNAIHGNIITALLLSIVLCGFIGFSIDFIGLRPLRSKNAPRIAALITTMGIGTILDNSVQIFSGTETKSFPNFLNFGTLHIGNAIISYTQIIIFITCILLLITLSIIVYKTKIGKSMLAVSQNTKCAQLMGINVKLIIAGTFIVSSILSCISGTLVGAYYQSIDTTMAVIIGMKTFAAAVLGGVGSLPGAMIGGIIVGLAESIGASYISSGLRDAIAFTILILVLLIKPNGLLGKISINKM